MTDLIPVVLLALACFVGGYFLLSRLLRGLSSGRQLRLPTEPIPPAWYDIVERRVPLAHDLSGNERERLLRLAQVFLAEKHFEGCGGVTVTEEMKVTIAAVACLLLLHLDGPCYPTLRTVLIYPHAFVSKRVGPLGIGEVVRPPVPLIGESWRAGVVVVAWDEVVSGTRDATDGHNVVLHELAHQLDGEDGVADGTPLLASGALRTWARVLDQEYERLRDDRTAQRLSALDPYGTTDKAEFFAVATESFFERPLQLEREHPELYGELKRFYGQDPARRASPTT